MSWKVPPRLAAALSAALLLSACSGVHDAVDRAADAAVFGLTGPRAQAGPPPASSGGAPPPAAIHGYTMALFQALFYQGGYNLATEDFEPGEYVAWEASGMGSGDWFRKALLKRRDDGAEWWRVKTHNDGDTFTMEALLAAADDASGRRILRLRVQYPGEQPQEVPVTEQDSRRWVVDSQRTLTQESYQGLKLGVEDVTVPAGTFTVDHLRSGQPGGGTVNWYLSDRVPGGVVKFRWERGDTAQVLALNDYGSGSAASELGAF
ncbi:MAG TPA: hypothetical protein VKA55_11190 [Gammaproteobacteria bacterium]|nr:hypothetical protein [Gammaproteobacteria bacterium]